MKQHVGLDVSQAVCVVDDNGRLLFEGGRSRIS